MEPEERGLLLKSAFAEAGPNAKVHFVGDGNQASILRALIMLDFLALGGRM